MSDIKKVTPQDALQDKACLILDVRTDIEHRTSALKQHHVHVPLDQLDAKAFLALHHLDGTVPLYILCRAGGRAAKAAQAFHSAGFGNVHVIEGGILNCEACGVPLKNTQVISLSLERQVRIAVGGFILLGTLLGAFLTPWFYLVPAFCGMGLIVAGVTEWCGMAMLLAQAPWNRSEADGSSKSCCTVAK